MLNSSVTQSYCLIVLHFPRFHLCVIKTLAAVLGSNILADSTDRRAFNTNKTSKLAFLFARFRSMNTNIDLSFDVKPQFEDICIAKRQNLRSNHTSDTILGITPPPAVCQSGPWSSISICGRASGYEEAWNQLTVPRFPAPTRVAAIAQHECQTPALRSIPSDRVDVRSWICEVWLCSRNSLATEVGKVRNLVLEHFCNSIRLQNSCTCRRRLAFIEERS